MPFQITLSRTDSPKNRLAKSLTDTLAFKFVFKAPTSYLNPVVLIQSGTSLIGYNYAQIQMDILRSYFITDIILVSQQNYEVHLREDVLATYSSAITSQSLFIDRTSNPDLYDLDIQDTMRPKKYIQTTEDSIPTADLSPAPTLSNNGFIYMPNGFTFTDLNVNTQFAVIVARSGEPIAFTGETYGKIPDRNNTLRIIPYPSKYPSVLMYCCDYQTMQYLVKWCNDNSDEAKSVVGIACYPYTIPHGTKVDTIRIAGKDVSTGVETEKSSYYPISIEPIVLADFLWKPSLTSYRHGYEIGDVSFQLFIPYLGNITLDNSLLADGDEIQVVYIPYYASNECLLMVSNVTKNVVMHSETITIAQEVPLTSSNAEAIRDTWTKIGIKTAVSLVADGLKVASGNPLGALSAVTSVARNTGDIISTALTTHYHSSVKVASADSGYSQWNQCYLTITKPDYTMYFGAGDEYNLRFGIPCEKFSTLASVAGTDTFYKTNIDRLEGSMTDTERSEAISLLNTGILVPPPSK